MSEAWFYLGQPIVPVEDYEPPEPERTPGDSEWVWCRWPDGRMWKHWRRQVRPGRVRHGNDEEEARSG